MGITQYILRRPRALQGEVSVSLTEQTRLLIVTEAPLSLSDPFICDVLRAMLLNEHQAIVLTPEQQAMLPDDIHCISWSIGLSAPVSAGGPQLASPNLAELYHNASAKRALWQQISDYESDFFTHAE